MTKDMDKRRNEKGNSRQVDAQPECRENPRSFANVVLNGGSRPMVPDQHRTNEYGTPVAQSDVSFLMMKCLQDLALQVTQLTSTINSQKRVPQCCPRIGHQ